MQFRPPVPPSRPIPLQTFANNAAWNLVRKLGQLLHLVKIDQLAGLRSAYCGRVRRLVVT